MYNSHVIKKNCIFLSCVLLFTVKSACSNCNGEYDQVLIRSQEAENFIRNCSEKIESCTDLEEIIGVCNKIEDAYLYGREILSEETYTEFQNICSINKNSFKNLKFELNSYLQNIFNSNKWPITKTLTNKEQIVGILSNPHIATLFAVIDTQRHLKRGFITEWELCEDGSIPGFLNGFTEAITCSTKELDLKYISKVRQDIMQKPNGTNYSYVNKINNEKDYQTTKDGLCTNCEYGAPHSLNYFCDFIRYMNGTFAFLNAPNTMVDDSYWQYLFYYKYDFFREIKQKAKQITPWIRGYESYKDESEIFTNLLLNANFIETEESFAKKVREKYKLDENLNLFSVKDLEDNRRVLGICNTNAHLNEDQLKDLFNKICSAYTEATKNPAQLTEKQKYEEILFFLKTFGMIHWLPDFNHRTSLILMYKEFYRLGLPFPIFDDPNYFVLLSVESLIDICKIGAQRLDTLIQYERINAYLKNIGTYDYGLSPVCTTKTREMENEVKEVLDKPHVKSYKASLLRENS